jgi:dipeptidyl aminopeptidase/acylaminoacyl peptidase
MCGTNAPYPDEMHPINLVTPTFPATCVVMADADQLVPPSQSQELFDRLQALGVDSKLVVAKGMGHGPAEAHQTDPAWPEGNDWWESAIRPSLDFVLDRISGKGEA